MYWQHKQLNQQILISRCKFPQNENIISLSWDIFSLETCPIPLQEFEEYLEIPRGVSEQGFEKIKEFFASQGAHEFICFIGIPKKAVQNA